MSTRPGKLVVKFSPYQNAGAQEVYMHQDQKSKDERPLQKRVGRKQIEPPFSSLCFSFCSEACQGGLLTLASPLIPNLISGNSLSDTQKNVSSEHPVAGQGDTENDHHRH